MANTRYTKTAVVALGVVDTAGGVLAWANPEGGSILVTRLVLNITTKATSACTCDFGVAADGVTSNDGLIDGLDTNAAAGVFDNAINHGTNGKAGVIVTSTQFVTGSKATGAAAGTVGFAYISYVRI